MTLQYLLFLIAAVALVASVSLSRMSGESPPRAVPPEPRDVESIDSIVAAVYDCISGAVGEPRDWDRFRSLMHPDAGRMAAVAPDPLGGQRLVVLRVEDYIERTGARFVEEGFVERELHRIVERFGHVAHVWSAYAWTTQGEQAAEQRGVNSLQLFFDGKRWWVTSIQWDAEREGQPIPPRFLPASEGD